LDNSIITLKGEMKNVAFKKKEGEQLWKQLSLKASKPAA
jgi:hypothetical protein